MTKDEFDSLAPGDIVRSEYSGQAYIVMANYGGRVTVARTVDMTNPPEWVMIQKASQKELYDDRS